MGSLYELMFNPFAGADGWNLIGFMFWTVAIGLVITGIIEVKR